jgi:outer membrane receptor for ferric coprogen and ferric-rhodotorulic acid
LKTPTDVSVLTRDFLCDVAADSYQDAALWLTGVTVTPGAAQGFRHRREFSWIRQCHGGYPSRNYFRYNNAVDDYISERLEAARGPTSLLFGDGVVAGVLNTITKRARIGASNTELERRDRDSQVEVDGYKRRIL